MRGAAVLFVTLYLLRALVAELNTALSGFHLWVFAGGLFVTYAALAMPFRSGFAASVLGGFLCDAMTPVAFGTHALLFGIAHVVVFNVRERLQREETGVRVIVALLVNLGLYLIISFTRIRHGYGNPATWPRMAADLTWSEAVIALVAPWFFALQLRTLEMARANPQRSA
jgi:rod shape-determining protein MreD